VWTGRKRKVKAMRHVTSAQLHTIKAKVQILTFETGQPNETWNYL